VAALLVLLVFWVVSGYAGYRGTAIAEGVARDLGSRPDVVVFSEKDLHLHGAGISVRTTSGRDEEYGYCYSGLRFLIRSDGRQFLLPRGWVRGRDPVIVLREDSSIRMEYATSTAGALCT
jgi:hypothetical protein